MHTSPAYAEDVYIGALNGVQIGEHHASFVVPVAALGVTTICRKIAARGGNRFTAPLTNRFDELDGIMWLDNVFVPWERVFLVEPVARADRHAGCCGITSTAGSPRPSSRSGWRWR